MTTVAFLGLGHMGLPMARNLQASGVRVVGFDVLPAAIDAASTVGLEVADSANAAAAQADVVITMLQNGGQVLASYSGVDGDPGLLTVTRPGTLFLDCSTIAVDQARAAHELAEKAGHRSLDAPVSGGVIGAQNATLAFMVGGSELDFEAARPLLEIMGQRIVHCGGPGLGQTAKVCNNMILAISQIAVGEAFVLGERLGLAHDALFEVASNATGNCWALTTNCPVPGPVPTSPANRDFQPGFASTLMAKDLGLALQAIELTGVDAQLGRHAQRLYADFAAGPGGQQDFSAIIRATRASSVTTVDLD